MGNSSEAHVVARLRYASYADRLAALYGPSTWQQVGVAFDALLDCLSAFLCDSDSCEQPDAAGRPAAAPTSDQ